MQLNPRYGSSPALVLDGDPSAIAGPLVRQRQRLLDAVRDFGPDEWGHHSRCEDWTARQVLEHLQSTNGFWELSIAAGMAGEQTTILSSFDPATTPSALMAGSTLSDQDVFDSFAGSVESLARLVESMTAADWSSTAESPAGHVSASAVAHHALWDCWIHERDILLPQGVVAAEEDDEVVACLRYAAGVLNAFDVGDDPERTGGFSIEATAPEVEVRVAITDHVSVSEGVGPSGPVLRGEAVELIEALSCRAPLSVDVDPAQRWMFNGLAEVFDQR